MSQAHTLWGGRFNQSPAFEFSRLNNSFSFDYRLLRFDIEGSIIYSKALHRAKVLTATEAKRIQRALHLLDAETSRRPEAVLNTRDKFEDVHSFVEAKLVERVGALGKKIHTGRSRNDQVALDLRLYLRHQSKSISQDLRRLMQALLVNAQKDLDTILPGYTHLQRAQPILLGHYWMAYFEMLSRDVDRFTMSSRRLNVMPLGSGALAGSGFRIDREFLARELGFESISKNSLDAVSDRDFALEFLANASILMMHLSRLAEDLILYSTAEFDFVELSDSMTSGSSLMPQKKNPDALELIRAKSSRVYANLQRLLIVLKALPLAYNKDLQEDKESIFDTVDTLESTLPAMIAVVQTLKVKPQSMRQAAEGTYSNATECVDYLVRKGVPFRTAHEIVGQLVLHAIQRKVSLDSLCLDEFRAFSPSFGSDVFAAIRLKRTIESKSLKGGTARSRVKRAIEDAKRYLAKIS